jgi:hypothetical protein
MRIINRVDYWRTRAKETRVIADLMQDDASRQSLLLSAKEYERMAQVAEKRCKKRAPQKYFSIH